MILLKSVLSYAGHNMLPSPHPTPFPYFVLLEALFGVKGAGGVFLFWGGGGSSRLHSRCSTWPKNLHKCSQNLGMQCHGLIS